MKPLHLLLLACVIGACTDEPPPRVEAEPAPAEAPARPEIAPGPDDAEPTAEEIPIVEDFEDQAKSEIKPDNLRAQLDALEQEIERDSQ
jgi:hypothetical protein